MKKSSHPPVSSQDFEKNFWKGRRLLVISPHPDDEVYGCGGTMAKAQAYGAEVFVVIASVSDLRFFEKKSLVRCEERLGEVQRVAKILKWKDFDVLYTDTKKHMKLDTVPQFDLIALLESEGRLSIDRVKPDIVAIPAPSYNQDHRAVYDACITSLRIHAGGYKHCPGTVLVYDSPTLSWSPAEERFHPNFYVDITETLAIKLKCVSAYASQKRDSRDPCSLESVEDLARTRGREIGHRAAEGFRLMRLVA